MPAFSILKALDGRDKIALLLPRSWSAAALWTKQDFEESLGKSEALGIKIVIGEKVRLRSYGRVGEPGQDRAFLAVQRKGGAHPEARQITALRHARFPMAILTFPSSAPLSHYMQFMHYAVGGLGYLRRMNFVTQPGVELYKAIAGRVVRTRETGWREPPIRPPGERSFGPIPVNSRRISKSSPLPREIEYGELTYLGISATPRKGTLCALPWNAPRDRIFRSRLKMPVDIYEGPAMNHSYHEMIIGHGKCFSIVMIAEKQAHFPLAHYEPDYHMAQFLATRMALERRGRHVVAVPIRRHRHARPVFPRSRLSSIKHGKVQTGKTKDRPETADGAPASPASFLSS